MPLPSLPPSLSRLQPLLLPLLLAAVAGLVMMGAMFSGKEQQVHQLGHQLQQANQQIEELGGQNQELTKQTRALQADKKTLEERLASLQSQLTAASSDLERVRTSASELKAQLESMTGERDRLRGQLSGMTDDRDEVKRKLAHTEDEKAELGRSLGRLRDRFAFLDRDYRELSEKVSKLQANPPALASVASVTGPAGGNGGSSPAVAPMPSTLAQASVELPPIIVRKDQAGMATPVRGRILEVNQPHNFVVVDKGSADGVRVGMVFDLIRGSDAVGRAMVVRVRPQLSACDIVRTKTPGPVQVGDLVVQGGS